MNFIFTEVKDILWKTWNAAFELRSTESNLWGSVGLLVLGDLLSNLLFLNLHCVEIMTHARSFYFGRYVYRNLSEFYGAFFCECTHFLEQNPVPGSPRNLHQLLSDNLYIFPSSLRQVCVLQVMYYRKE